MSRKEAATIAPPKARAGNEALVCTECGRIQDEETNFKFCHAENRWVCERCWDTHEHRPFKMPYHYKGEREHIMHKLKMSVLAKETHKWNPTERTHFASVGDISDVSLLKDERLKVTLVETCCGNREPLKSVRLSSLTLAETCDLLTFMVFKKKDVYLLKETEGKKR